MVVLAGSLKRRLYGTTSRQEVGMSINVAVRKLGDVSEPPGDSRGFFTCPSPNDESIQAIRRVVGT
jgi:hypothetical protein